MATIAKAVKKVSSANTKKTTTKVAKPMEFNDEFVENNLVEPKNSATVKKPIKKLKVTKTLKIEKPLDEKNLKETVTKMISQKREIKYIYPDNMGDDQMAKKAYRVKIRNKNKNFLAEIAKLKKTKADPKSILKIEKEYNTFRKEHYLVP
jgi:hypothetical protein